MDLEGVLRELADFDESQLLTGARMLTRILVVDMATRQMTMGEFHTEKILGGGNELVNATK